MAAIYSRQARPKRIYKQKTLHAEISRRRGFPDKKWSEYRKRCKEDLRFLQEGCA
jgi:hypothetical protein